MGRRTNPATIGKPLTLLRFGDKMKRNYFSPFSAAICVGSIFLFATMQANTFSQTPTRARQIELNAAAAEDPPVLELLSIEVRGFPVSLSQRFTADDGWLQQMTIQVRNISGKPIRCFNFGGGLIERLDEVSQPGESFKQGITWAYGRCKEDNSKAQSSRSLQPNAIVELTYHDVAAWVKLRRAQEKGRYAKLAIGPPYVEFTDGSEARSGGIKTKQNN